MKLEFLGTRGNIEPRTQKHERHSSLKVSYYHNNVIIDCGEDWMESVMDWDADAIVVTHAHPDHAFGLKNGAPCPVYATSDAWESMETFVIEDIRTIPKREPIKIPNNGNSSLTFEAFPVLHSTRATAVGYRVKAGNAEIFYVPDVAWIKDRKSALRGVNAYIGDGATFKRSMIRKPGETIIGHAPIQTQLTWCKKTGVKQAIFTHLGSQIVDGDEEEKKEQIKMMAEERDISEIWIAFDGMTRIFR